MTINFGGFKNTGFSKVKKENGTEVLRAWTTLTNQKGQDLKANQALIEKYGSKDSLMIEIAADNGDSFIKINNTKMNLSTPTMDEASDLGKIADILAEIGDTKTELKLNKKYLNAPSTLNKIGYTPQKNDQKERTQALFHAHSAFEVKPKMFDITDIIESYFS